MQEERATAELETSASASSTNRRWILGRSRRRYVKPTGADGDEVTKTDDDSKSSGASSFRRGASSGRGVQSAGTEPSIAARVDANASGLVDSRYEFRAPKFYDFVEGKEDPKVDSWFDEKHPSPARVSQVGTSSGVFGSNSASFFVSLSNSPLKSPAKRETRLSKRLHGSAGRTLKPRPSSATETAASSSASLAVQKPHAAPMQPQITQAEDFPVIEASTKRRLVTSVPATPAATSGVATHASAKSLDPFIPMAVPIRSTKPLTIPQEFHFATECRTHPMKLRDRDRDLLGPKKNGGVVQKKQQKKNATTKAATTSIAHAVASSGLGRTLPDRTVPKPFNFHTAHSAAFRQSGNTEVSRSPFVPLAVKVKQFETTVPDRFKTKAPLPMQSLKHSPSKLTQPKSPFLRTKMRQKPMARIPTLEERELAELQPEFRAKPLNKKILETSEPLGVPQKQPAPLTVPESPAIQKPRPPPPRPETPQRHIKANPVPDLTKPDFQPVIEHRLVLPKPVKLPGDEITEKKRKEHEENVQKLQELERKAREFKARPLPDDEPDPLPDPAVKPTTKPEPFPLLTDQRGQIHRTKFQRELEAELQDKENAANFHANPLYESVPFIPKKSTKPLTVADDITLHTEVRAEERKGFDEEIRAKEEEERRRKDEAMRQQELISKKEARKLRELAVPRANPIKHYPPIMIKPSVQKLTEPMSPMIGEKRKRLEKEIGRSKMGMRPVDIA
ncbi:hypothetical protein M427DRAFT_130397 [Gonapodya prolifera JEL478]|uniref:TPX2 C-terminal domain-containing protein n=1 Tax=Gonapodya prolifera (strain JEL478) TaxID=1344416 RepID=A0A139AY71_GONPJ|nr:hypothetical protein M427DRAFT_130397 [Gonapodya prolifera JEL478]|eukprot:KXS21647.1 hypothetical protein M427DRAFT_130397 [Gonapodya prolifera JEL478]